MTADLTVAEGCVTFKYTSLTSTWCSGEHRKVKHLSLCVWWQGNMDGLALVRESEWFGLEGVIKIM